MDDFDGSSRVIPIKRVRKLILKRRKFNAFEWEGGRGGGWGGKESRSYSAGAIESALEPNQNRRKKTISFDDATSQIIPLIFGR